jgi:stress response protein SCP2
VSSTRRQPFSTRRAHRLDSEGHLTAHVGHDRRGAYQGGITLDLSAFLVGADDRVVAGDRRYCVFFNNRVSTDRSTRYLDDRAGGGGLTRTQLNRVDESVQRIAFGISIYDGDILRHTFGNIPDACFWIEGQPAADAPPMRLYSANLSAVFPRHAAVIIGEAYRSGRIWNYRPLGGGHTYANLVEMGRVFGVHFDS